jgi:carbonic anhydrase
MTVTQKQTGQSGKNAEKKLPTEPLEASRFRELREKHLAGGQGALSAKEAEEMCDEGNLVHRLRLQGSGTTPKARQARIEANDADYLVIACSDARNPTLDSEEDGAELVGLQNRVAGNVIPTEGVSLDEIKEAAARVKKGGLVLISAHVHCGAVGEYVKWKKAGMGDTGSEPLNTLLHAVGGENPHENAAAQLERLKDFVGEDKNVGVLYYDWESGKVDVLCNEPSGLAEALQSKWALWHKEADTDGHLGERLSKTQKPHSIVIGSNNLPFSVDTIFAAKQNEIFSTTGSEGGLDHFDEASVLYAVEHLGTKHIAFVAHGPNAQEMFDKWEADLRTMGSVAQRLDSGELVITRKLYDLETGATETLQKAA